MTPRQMLAFGELYLNRGRAGESAGRAGRNGSTRHACRARARGGIRIASTATAGGSRISAAHRACFAWGFGGQYIFVFRELDLVVAVTSSTTRQRRAARLSAAAVRSAGDTRAAAADAVGSRCRLGGTRKEGPALNKNGLLTYGPAFIAGGRALPTS